MSAGAPAIPAPGPFPGSHAPPIGQLRVARRPNRPPSGPLRAFQPQGHTPRSTPLKPLSTPFPSAAASARSTAPPPTSNPRGYPDYPPETPVNAVSKRRCLRALHSATSNIDPMRALRR